MRMLFFLLGMIGFISAGMLHLPLLGLLGFVCAVVALFLATPQPRAHHAVSISYTDESTSHLVGDSPRATDAADIARQPRTTRRMPHHSARHQTWHALPAHTSSQQRRVMQREK